MLETVVLILLIASGAYVLLTLIMGAKAMGGKTTGARESSNKWMQRRVLGQFIAIALLFAYFYVKRSNGG